MRAWLYDTLVLDPAIIDDLDGVDVPQRIMPRQSRDTVPGLRPFLIYGLGNATSERLSDEPDHEAHRQFFQVWVHDQGGDYGVIDTILGHVKTALHGKTAPAHLVTQVIWLENSQELSNETYGTIFRYARFQAIISKGATS